MEIIICYIVIYLVEAFIIKQYCSTLFVSRHTASIEWSTVLLLYGFLFAVSFVENPILNTVAFLIMNFIFMFFSYEIKGTTALFHSVIATISMCLSELVIVGIVSNLATNYYKSDTYLKNLIFLTLTSKPLYFLFLFTISHGLVKTPKNQGKTNAREIILFSIIPLVSFWVALTFSSICYYAKLPDDINRMITISSILLLLSNIIIYGIYAHSTEKNREFTELQLQLQKENDAVSYYKMLLSQNEAQNVLIHDIKKHLQAIALLNQQNEPEKVASYIDNLVSSSDLQTGARMSDNEFFNAILCRYKRYCTEHQISFHTDIRSSTVNFMAENDLTALFCNLLDNAIESAIKQTDSLIELHVAFKSEANLTVITMINSCRINPFRKSDGKLPSTKKDSVRHGFGLKSINRIIERYHGHMELYYDEEERLFHTIITLKKPV